MEKHVYPSDEEETDFWSQSMKDVIRQDRCKRTKKQNKTFKQNAFLRIHTDYWAPRRGSFGECCQARITGNLTLYLSKSPSRGVPMAFHISPEDLKPSKVFPFPVLSPPLSRFVQSPCGPCSSLGSRDWMGLWFSLVMLPAEPSPSACKGCSSGTALARPAASSLLTSLPLHPTWLMIIALPFPLVIPNCMSFPQLNSNQYPFCVSQGSPGERTNIWRDIV